MHGRTVCALWLLLHAVAAAAGNVYNNAAQNVFTGSENVFTGSECEMPGMQLCL
jgi:hypothetical protein